MPWTWLTHLAFAAASSVQGESRIRCRAAVCYWVFSMGVEVCYSVIFHGCGGGVFDLSLRRGWFCVVGVLFVVSIVIEELLLLV